MELLKRFVEVLSQEDRKTLLKLLDGKEQEQQIAKQIEEETRKKEWKNKRKPELLAEIDALVKEVKNIKPQTISFDLKLTLTANLASPLVADLEYVESNLKSGYGYDGEYEVTGKITSLNGRKVIKSLAFINDHLDDFLSGACDEVLQLFPDFKNNKEKHEKIGNKISNDIKTVRLEGFDINN